jgi:hypothetical protein
MSGRERNYTILLVRGARLAGGDQRAGGVPDYPVTSKRRRVSVEDAMSQEPFRRM